MGQKNGVSDGAPTRPAPPYAPPAPPYAPPAPPYAPPAPQYAPPAAQYAQPGPQYAPSAPQNLQVQNVVSGHPPQLLSLSQQQVMSQPVYLAQQGPTTFAPAVSAPNPYPLATTITLVGRNEGSDRLLPGMCSVCRMGRIKNSPSICTYLFCLILLPLGILPGLLAYYFCCRKPTCGSCRYKF